MTKKLNIRINKPETNGPVTVTVHIPVAVLRDKSSDDVEAAAKTTVAKAE